jgi:hypothetical protein
MILPTVKIRQGNGYQRINESDFDPAIHVLWVDPPADFTNLSKVIINGVEIPFNELVVNGVNMRTVNLGEGIQDIPDELPPVKRGWPKGKPRKA